MRANGFYGTFEQPVSLRKSYAFRNEGVQIQYILKNESPLNLSGVFAIEINLALTGLKNIQPTMAVYAQNQRIEGPVTSSHFQDLSWIRLDDCEAESKFTYEANENPEAILEPILHNTGARLFLYWRVELGPSFETEKMVFMKIDT